MMDYENVYYVDGRNAVVDHRVGARLPGGRTTNIVSTAPPASMAISPNTSTWSPAGTGPVYQYQQPAVYGPVASSSWGYPVNPPYVMPPVMPPNNLASILGGLGDVGSLASILAQVVAAFLPLPAAPTPQDTTDNDNVTVAAAVNSSNLIRYQSALALFARRDQQILTLGSVLKELFKRPGTVIG
jgi:hypothetical protein